ncbi:MFS transporter [Thermaurantiacus tibetensis]|uniref:MFS transporter n=1 Tax=Thermaurantiacus tibetensis TaxID=2759035 RepID=UPI002E29DA06|nr:MFS transporter [Thermaurantiacus tibetensis]
MLLACLLGVATGASPVPYNSIGFFMPELAREYGWSFGAMSLGITIFGVLAASLAPLFGAMADRHGARPVALASLGLFGLAFASFALIGTSIWTYYAIWVLVGFVGIGSTPVTFSRIVNLWFFRNRGLALGIMLIGTSLAALVIPPLVTWAIGAHGWRTAHLVLAALPLLVGLPVGLLLLREPREAERPQGDVSAAAGITFAEALKDRRFWAIFASIFLVAFAYGGAHIHMPEIVKLHGFTPERAANIMQILGLSILAGRLVTGFLLDRFWAPAVCLPILCLPAIATVALAGTSPDFAVAAGAAFLLGFAAGAESDLIAYLASRYFGLAHYGRIYGTLYMAFAIASAISPAVYGRVRDLSGSYDPMLFAAAGLFVGGALLLLTLGRYPVLKAPGTVPAAA